MAGLVAAAQTLGAQSTPGVGVTIKHSAANNQETDPTATNSVNGERALREIYLRGFQITVQTAQPMAVMSSYNKINGLQGRLLRPAYQPAPRRVASAVR